MPDKGKILPDNNYCIFQDYILLWAYLCTELYRNQSHIQYSHLHSGNDEL